MNSVLIFIGVWSAVGAAVSPLARRAFFLHPSYSSPHVDPAPCGEAAPRATSRQAAAVAGGASKLPAPDAG